MKKLLTEGLRHTEFKDTEIGRIPKRVGNKGYERNIFRNSTWNKYQINY